VSNQQRKRTYEINPQHCSRLWQKRDCHTLHGHGHSLHHGRLLHRQAARQGMNDGFRRQSGIPTVSTECLKADIDYRLPTLLVVDENLSES